MGWSDFLAPTAQKQGPNTVALYLYVQKGGFMRRGFNPVWPSDELPVPSSIAPGSPDHTAAQALEQSGVLTDLAPKIVEKHLKSVPGLCCIKFPDAENFGTETAVDKGILLDSFSRSHLCTEIVQEICSIQNHVLV